MKDSYSFHSGSIPLLVSVPHDGRHLPKELEEAMTTTGKSMPDTDWHVAELYEFVKDMGAALITATYSRYVVDLNRPADDAALYSGQLATGLCPVQTFAGEEIYRDKVSIDIDARADRFWHPYHVKISETLAEYRRIYGYALLWDAHSITSRVPRLFDGELPELNIGTWNGHSCSSAISLAVMQAAEESPFETVLNGRFKGGYITRHYGRPDNNIHAVQLEIAQRAYMDEATKRFDDAKASRLRKSLRTLLGAFVQTAGRNAVIMAQ